MKFESQAEPWIEIVNAIHDDKSLKQAFLSLVSASIVDRRDKMEDLIRWLTSQRAPAELVKFVGQLRNEKLANWVKSELEK